MWAEVVLIVSLPGADDYRRGVFERAMQHRRWVPIPGSPDAWRVDFANVRRDSEVVKICEHDIKESAYVAGVSGFQAVCLMSDGETVADDEHNLHNLGYRCDPDDFGE